MCGFSHTQNVIVHCWRCVTSPQSALVDPVAASSGSYPAAPSSAPPDSCNLHPGLLQQHLWTVTLLLLVVVLIAFSIFPKQFATCKTEVVTPLTCITQLWVIQVILSSDKKKANQITDTPVLQDILVPHQLPRNVQSSCEWPCSIFLCVCKDRLLTVIRCRCGIGLFLFCH